MMSFEQYIVILFYAFFFSASVVQTIPNLCSMGFLRNPQAFLQVLKAALERTNCRFILFTAGYEPLDASIQAMGNTSSDCDGRQHFRSCADGVLLFDGRLFCFSGSEFLDHSIN